MQSGRPVSCWLLIVTASTNQVGSVPLLDSQSSSRRVAIKSARSVMKSRRSSGHGSLVPVGQSGHPVRSPWLRRPMFAGRCVRSAYVPRLRVFTFDRQEWTSEWAAKGAVAQLYLGSTLVRLF